MSNVLSHLKPELVWKYFEEITQVPHPSKKEEKIRQYMISWAQNMGFEYKSDKLGNLVIKKPATPGMENRKTVCIQGHLDMVCEKNSDVEFDFDNEPLKIYIDGDWVKAQGTTLGADNGIGIAMGMALMASNDIPHPALELLCTLDEETGLTGAIQLGTDLLNADILLNLDSEDEGAFTIGCAGGLNTSGIFKYESDEVPANHTAYKLSLKGLRGGHSGIEIHDGRANAAKLLSRFLWNATRKFGVRLVSFNSGNKHNAIPREAFATILVENTKTSEFEQMFDKCADIFKKEYATKEPNLHMFYEKTELPNRVLKSDIAYKILSSFVAMPHGVIRMSPDIPGLVQTSTNFAIVETRENEIYVLTSQRSSVESEKKFVENMVYASLELGGAEISTGDGYPAWEPNVNSEILNIAKDIYKKVLGKEPKIEAIHAGLECGLIGEKYPGIDMLSFGPNLKDVHSPDEKVSISSVERIWNFLVELIKNIPQK